MTASELNVFLYGSCVSRDTAEFMEGSWVRSGYIARQSLISAMNSKVPMPRPSGLTSKFQNSMVEGDFASSLPSTLRHASESIDRLVIDLVDERLGVYPYPENRYLTFSNELHQSGLMNNMKGRQAFVPFGDDLHFELWSSAAQSFTDLLVEASLLAKSRVIVAPFVDHTLEGESVTQTRDLSAKVWNERYIRYYDLLEELGFNLVSIPEESVLSTETHKWGSAQYHYVDSAYKVLASKIELD